MPETRYAEVYQDGELVSTDPYEVSDVDLELESARQTIEVLSAKADNEITTLEMAQFLKALAKLR